MDLVLTLVFLCWFFCQVSVKSLLYSSLTHAIPLIITDNIFLVAKPWLTHVS